MLKQDSSHYGAEPDVYGALAEPDVYGALDPDLFNNQENPFTPTTGLEEDPFTTGLSAFLRTNVLKV